MGYKLQIRRRALSENNCYTSTIISYRPGGRKGKTKHDTNLINNRNPRDRRTT